MITDYALAAACGAMAVLLYRSGRARAQDSVLVWAAGFAALGLSAAVGGTVHGFSLHLGPTMLAAMWKFTTLAVGVLSLCLLSGAALAYSGGMLRRALLALAVLKFLVYAAWMTMHDEFRFVIYDTGIAMSIVLLLSLRARVRRDGSAGWLLAGIAASVAAAYIQYSRVELHVNFNHNDLYHVIQIAAMYLFYRGGLLFGRRP